MKNKKPVVSILIISFNERDRLSKVLKSLKKIKSPAFEIIVCDNDSKDGTQEFVKKNFPDVLIVKSSKNIGTAVYNLAIQMCRGKYILFIANDMLLSKNAITELVKVLEKNPDAAQCAPKLLDFAGKPSVNACYFSRSFYGIDICSDKLGDKIRVIPHIGTGLIRKKSLDKIGGVIYDPDYFLYNEDMDLGLRIRLVGMKTLWCPTAVVRHSKPTTTIRIWSRPQLTFFAQRNSLITYFKTCSLFSLILFFPYVLSIRILLITRDLLLMRFSNAIARLMALSWFFSHPIFLIKKRNATQKLRKAPDSYVFAAANEKKFLSSLFTGGSR